MAATATRNIPMNIERATTSSIAATKRMTA